MTITDPPREDNGSGRYAVQNPTAPEPAVTLISNGRRWNTTPAMATAYEAKLKARSIANDADRDFQVALGRELEGFVRRTWPTAVKVSFRYDPDEPTDAPYLVGVLDADGNPADKDRVYGDAADLQLLNFAAEIDGPYLDGTLLTWDEVDEDGEEDISSARHSFILGEWR